MRVKIKTDSGQTLLEIIIALMVAALVVVALATVAIRSVNDAKLAENRTIAAKYAQEGLEQVRIVRDRQGWDVFSSYSTSTSPANNCYKVNTDNWTLENISCSSYETIGVFSRRIILTRDGNLIRNVRVEVVWTDKGGTQTSIVDSKLSKWR